MAVDVRETGLWRLMRTKTGAADDTDHVDVQSSPPAAELIRIGKGGGHWTRGQPEPYGMMFFLTWIDNNGEILSPDVGTTRGTFDVEVLEIVTGYDDDAPADAATIITDSTTLTGCSGYRQYIIDGMRESVVWLRLTNIIVPTSGSPTKIQLWTKALEGG